MSMTEKADRAAASDENGVNPAYLFQQMSEVVPEHSVIAVDVSNNTYSFGRYFETKAGQELLMSGYLGSIGFAFPAAIGEEKVSHENVSSIAWKTSC